MQYSCTRSRCLVVYCTRILASRCSTGSADPAGWQAARTHTDDELDKIYYECYTQTTYNSDKSALSTIHKCYDPKTDKFMCRDRRVKRLTGIRGRGRRQEAAAQPAIFARAIIEFVLATPIHSLCHHLSCQIAQHFECGHPYMLLYIADVGYILGI